MRGRDDDNDLVWSSDGGRRKPPAKAASPSPSGDGVVRVSRETRGRKGKGVTLVSGVPLGGPQLKELAKRLKQRCGSGGTVKNGVIEIQGDHRDTIVAELADTGWTIRKAGG